MASEAMPKKILINADDQREMLALLGVVWDEEAKAWRNQRAEAVATILCLTVSIIRELLGPDRDDATVQEWAKGAVASLSQVQAVEKDADVREKLRPMLDRLADIAACDPTDETAVERVLDQLIADYILLRRVKL